MHTIVRASDLLSARVQAFRANLFVNDETTSRLMYLLDPTEEAPDQIENIWLVKDDRQNPIGVAVVSRHQPHPAKPVLNMYVHADHQNQGLGSSLLKEVVKTYGSEGVEGYYTLDSVRLYQRHQLAPCEIRGDAAWDLLKEGRVREAHEHFIAEVLKEREEYDRQHRCYVSLRRPR